MTDKGSSDREDRMYKGGNGQKGQVAGAQTHRESNRQGQGAHWSVLLVPSNSVLWNAEVYLRYLEQIPVLDYRIRFKGQEKAICPEMVCY
jgi:hypothetical protein